MTFLSSILLYLVAPFTALLAYFHYSAVREEAEKKRTKFNADYNPAETDCTVELSFTKAGVDKITIALGQTVAGQHLHHVCYCQDQSSCSHNGFQGPSQR